MHRNGLLTAALTSLSWTTFAAAHVQTGACCVDDPVIGLHCIEITAGDCIQANGFYYGDGTDCSQPFVECDAASTDEGACCWWDGALWQCTELEAYKCNDIAGTWYGLGVSCGDPQVVCPLEEESGACCIDESGNGQYWCYQLTQTDCSLSSGYFYGVGVPCSDPMVECHEPQGEEGACCMIFNGALTCVQVNHLQCEDSAGTWFGYGVLCSDPIVVCDTGDDLGACCLDEDGDGQYWCVQTTLIDCSQSAGYFYGIGVPCSDPMVECETPPSTVCVAEPGAQCAGRPNYAFNAYQANFGDSIAVQTASPAITGGFVLTVFDLSDTAGAPTNSWFALDRWSHPTWTQNTLGSIFGLALDGDGAIYVAASRSWWMDISGPSGWGAVYRVDPVSGAVSTFATLPNTWSGLGNITFDCDNDQFFVTNFEDGKIYRLDMAGATLDAWDPGPAFDGVSPVAQGDRPFAVEVHEGRLYWSMWNDDQLTPSATALNEIWSIELDATGACMGGTEALEIAVPVYFGDWSSPVSDIRFSPRGTMLLAERTAAGIDAMGAHDARLLEYECVSGAWVPSMHLYDVGQILQSSAGGVDCTLERTWVSADAMHLGSGDNMYGIQGMPASGGSILDSLLIDYQDDLTNQDKTLLGDLVVVPASGQIVQCPILQDLHVTCHGTTAPWSWDLTVGVSNMDPAATITQLELVGAQGVTMTPDVFAMNLTPQHSWSVDTLLEGAANGSTVCLDVLVTFGHGAVCEDVLCIELPQCGDTLPGDLDGDWFVGVNDLLIVLGAFGETCPEGCIADLDDDGVVGVNDLLMLMSCWS